jgi:predicted DCC family thiol-disulfide oxidoreductase YuxK
MKLPITAHTSRPWRIHELTSGLRLEDVWALPTPGGADDFPRLVQLIASGDPSQSSSRAVRTLFAIRWKVGGLLGWDDTDGNASERPTLRDRMPADLRDGPPGPDFDTLPFSSLYLTDDEWAVEVANRTVYGVMHIGWVPDGTGGYHGQMAVYGKPNGLLGRTYMAAIRPFRHVIVYPPMIREFGREWHAQADGPTASSWAVLYDADCGFCKWLLSGLLEWDRAARLRPIALQRPEADDLLSELEPVDKRASWHLISPTGVRHSGGAAMAPLLELLPGGRLPAAGFARFPGLSDRAYRWVAEHRSQLSRWIPSSAKRHASQRVQRRERAPAS